MTNESQFQSSQLDERSDPRRAADGYYGYLYLSTIAARTLLVYGNRDELVTVPIALEMYTAIPRSYLWIIPNAGHGTIFSSLHEPWGLRPFIQAVLPFLRGDWERGRGQAWGTVVQLSSQRAM